MKNVLDKGFELAYTNFKIVIENHSQQEKRRWNI